ncbi:prolyl endopeptidase [Filimonas lacunae]|nr:prolyl endopeptidase [Filimonas lacunae]
MHTAAQPLWKYPVAVKDTVADRYFDTTIYDPYRWLENDTIALTRQWIAQQNAATQDYLATIPFREKIRAYLTRKWNYTRETPPVKMGEYYLFSRNNGLQNQNVWYLKKGLVGKEEVLLDPNTFSADGTVAVTMLGASADKRYIAYAVAEGGSDWNRMYVLDVTNRTRLPDMLQWVKFPRAAWKGNGFYYSRYPAPEKGHELFARNTGNAIYYHHLGSSQETDSLVFTDGSDSKVSVGASVTEDERFLIICAVKGSFLGYKLNSSTGNALFCQDLSVPHSPIDTLVSDYNHHNIIIDNAGGDLLLQTDRDAPANKVVLMHPHQPQPSLWKLVVPEQKESLVNIETGGGFMWLQYLQDASSVIHQYTYSGSKVGAVALPAIGTASGFAAGKRDTALFYTFTNCVTPPAIYLYVMTNGQSAVYSQPRLDIDANDYVIKRVFCTSKDSTRVPMFIVHKKGMLLDASHPAFVLGHGGFKRNLTPFFHVAIMMFLEQGGVYAQPALRGGNEYGEAWHQGGMRQNKQHVFDDCIAATEYLVKEGYTQPGRIAISGQSTGAVMVAACSNQRPDLFKVALPAVGMQDMLRYHKFTIGASWAEEYGTSDKEAQFRYLVRYSPLHNIRPGIHPATFITTADHDDTVVPGHSYKFAAALQANQQGDNPVFIRIDSRSGHGPGKPTHKQIEEATDVWSFVFRNLGMDFH